MKMEDVKVGMKIQHSNKPIMTITNINEDGCGYKNQPVPLFGGSMLTIEGTLSDVTNYEPFEPEYEPTPQDLAWLSANHILSELKELCAVKETMNVDTIEILAEAEGVIHEIRQKQADYRAIDRIEAAKND